MRTELQLVLDAAKTLAPEALPELLGELEQIRVTALARLSAPVVVAAHQDRLLGVQEAARTLGVSSSFVYRNAATFAFTRRVGRSLKFSSQGIEHYLNGGRRRR